MTKRLRNARSRDVITVTLPSNGALTSFAGRDEPGPINRCGPSHPDRERAFHASPSPARRTRTNRTRHGRQPVVTSGSTPRAFHRRSGQRATAEGRQGVGGGGHTGRDHHLSVQLASSHERHDQVSPRRTDPARHHRSGGPGDGRPRRRGHGGARPVDGRIDLGPARCRNRQHGHRGDGPDRHRHPATTRPASRTRGRLPPTERRDRPGSTGVWRPRRRAQPSGIPTPVGAAREGKVQYRHAIEGHRFGGAEADPGRAVGTGPGSGTRRDDLRCHAAFVAWHAWRMFGRRWN